MTALALAALITFSPLADAVPADPERGCSSWDRTEYVRVMRSESMWREGHCASPWDNERHAGFWSLPPDEREARVLAAVEASL